MRLSPSLSLLIYTPSRGVHVNGFYMFCISRVTNFYQCLHQAVVEFREWAIPPPLKDQQLGNKETKRLGDNYSASHTHVVGIEDTIQEEKILNIMLRRKPKLTLQPSMSTPSLSSMSPLSSLPSFEYEDIIFPKRTDFSLKLTDLLARESDVTVSNQVTPRTEYRGFALHLVVSLLHLVWILWTFLPKSWLNKMGVYYYPSRWWSLAISSYVLMLMLYIYLALQLWNIEVETIRSDDLRVICDGDAVIETDVAKYGWEDTNGVYDLRITDVNNVLYGD